MVEYRKLLLKVADALELDDELAAIESLNKALADWQKLKSEITSINVQDITSGEDLLTAIAETFASEDIKKAFEAAGLKDAYAAISGFLGKVQEVAGNIPAKYKALLSKLSSVPDADLLVTWTIAGKKPATDPKGRYSLNLGASVTAGFEARATWADGEAKLIRIGASGKLEADGKARAPYGAFIGSGGAKASLKTELGYFFAPKDQNQLYALAVANRLGKLPDPFDFTSVWRAFEETDLDVVDYKFGGAANANLQVNFADVLALGAGVAANVGLTVSVATSLTSNYRLSLQRKAAGGPAFRAQLRRDRVEQTDLGWALQAEADLSSITAPVIKAFGTAVDRWDDALKTIRPYLSPGTLLREKAQSPIKGKIGPLIQNEKLRAAVLSDIDGALGLRDGNNVKVVDWLFDRVAEAADRASVVVSGAGANAIDQVWSELQKAAPELIELAEKSGAPDLKALADDLKAAVAGQLQAIEDEFVKTARAAFKPGDNALRQAIGKAADHVNRAVNSADDALKSIRELLAHYDTVIQATFKKVKEAAESKAKARLFREETHTTGMEAEVVIDFLLNKPEAATTFDALARGSLQRLVQIIDDKAGKSGGAIDLIEGKSSITRFTKTQAREGLEISFLGISVSYIAQWTTGASVKVDGDGNIYVNSSAELEKVVSTPFGTREVGFSSTHALVLAKATRGIPGAGQPTMDMGVSAGYADKTLQWGDINDFVAALAKGKVMDGAVLTEAKAAFQAWATKAGGNGKINGEVAGHVRLSGPAIEKVLTQGRQDGKLTDAGKLAVINAGRLGLIASGEIDEKTFDEDAETARIYFFRKPGDISTDLTLLLYRDEDDGIPGPNKADDIRPADNVWPKPNNVKLGPGKQKDQLVRFLEYGYFFMHLVELVDQMGRVYEAAPEAPDKPSGWKETDYEVAQKKIVTASKNWLKAAEHVKGIFEPEATRRTTAFMRAMATLAGVDPKATGGAILTLTYNPKTGDPETVSFGKAVGAA